LENLSDLEAALNYNQKAVELTPDDSPDRARRLQSLGLSFIDRYIRLQHLGDLEALNKCYTDSFKTTTESPQSSWIAALIWASFGEQYQPTYCVPAFSAAFHLLPELLWIGHSIPVRHDTIHRLNINQATSAAMRTCISLTSLATGVEFMEQGLATVFQQNLQLKANVDGLQSTQIEKFQQLSLKLYSRDFQQLSLKLYSRAHDTSNTLVNERNTLLKEIREQPGFENFLLPKPYNVLCQASQGGPVVILNSHKTSCDGIIILNPTSEPVHVAFPMVTLELLESQRTFLKQLLGHCRVRIRGESASIRLQGYQEQFKSKTSAEHFSDMLSWLWIHIVGPVYEVLKLVS
jgi:hypothetical protein